MIILVMLLPILISPATAEKPSSITWSRTYELLQGSDAVAQTSDGGFVIAGAYLNVWVLKTGATGEPEWEREYPSAGYWYPQVASVQQTLDRGYLVAGAALPRGSVSPFEGFLLKLDGQGSVQWTKTYSGRADDGFYMAQQTSDGGYVVAGNTESVSSHSFNGWILRLDGTGDTLWQKAFVGEDIHSVDNTRDGGFVVAGTVGVDNRAEAWVFKLDHDGNIVWQKAYEVATRTEAFSIQQIRDGGYIMAGHSSIGALVLRLDREGNIRWQKTLNGSGFTASSASETPDHGFMIAGYNVGFFLLKLDTKGNIIWLKTYGAEYGFLQSVQPIRDGGFVAVGRLVMSDLSFHAWVLRLDPQGGINGCVLAVPSSATLTDATANITNTNVGSVSANEEVDATTVTANGVQANVQTQCLTIATEKQERKGDIKTREDTEEKGKVVTGRY